MLWVIVYSIHYYFQCTVNVLRCPGYAQDPIAEWKKRAAKIKGLMAIEDDGDEESDEEPEPEKGKPGDPGMLRSD